HDRLDGFARPERGPGPGHDRRVPGYPGPGPPGPPSPARLRRPPLGGLRLYGLRPGGLLLGGLLLTTRRLGRPPPPPPPPPPRPPAPGGAGSAPAAISGGYALRKARWPSARFSPASIVGAQTARGGTSIPASRSAASTTPSSLAKAPSQSCRLASTMIWR